MSRSIVWLSLGSLGAVAFVMALGFGFGGGSAIGSAVFPLAMAGVLIAMSVLGLVFQNQTERSLSVEIRPMTAIAASVILFMLLVEWAGIIPTAVICMVTAYAGQTDTRYGGFLIYSLLFGVALWLIFALLLGLPVSALGFI